MENIYFIILSNLDPFDYIGFDVTNNKELRSLGASAYNLILVIGIIGLAISMTICGMKIAINRDSNKKSQAKEVLGSKLILALGFFSFLSLVGIVIEMIQEIT